MICNSHKVSGRKARENVSSRTDRRATAASTSGPARRTIERTEETTPGGQCTAYRWTRPKQRTRKRRKRKTQLAGAATQRHRWHRTTGQGVPNEQHRKDHPSSFVWPAKTGKVTGCG
ncbi:uncharacterized protein LOC126561423 [Anopheles maculipalpis]|uniref:uncharacterized protein LOC126561423 n=1 Tax=Anopheles maculipalpis TaxID=1496333 RepID=UPI00215999A3|nr:uncharacterized protein LOC126561423 [Anopheles maculipalpis]